MACPGRQVALARRPRHWAMPDDNARSAASGWPRSHSAKAGDPSARDSSHHSPSPSSAGPAKRTRTRCRRRRGGGLFDAAGPGRAVPGRTFVPRKIPPACAPSGDAQPRGPSVACGVTQTYTDRRHKEWLLSRSTASRPALPAPPPSTPRPSMTDDARPAGRDRKAPADLYGMRGRRRAHPSPPHLRCPGPRRRCGRALVLWQGGERA